MNKKLYLLVGVLLVLLLPLCLGVGEELSYEPNTTMEIIIKCFDVNSNLCSDSTTCELDVFYPNMTNWIYNQTMTWNGTFFNYTAPETETLGVYHASAVCSDGSDSGYTSFDFYVGRPSTEVQSGITTTAIFILIIVAGLFFIGFIFVKKAPYKWSFFLFSLLFMVMTLNIASISLRNEAGSENIRNIFDQIGAGCYIMYWFIGGLFFFIWILTFIASLSERRHMKMAERIGMPLDFDKSY